MYNFAGLAAVMAGLNNFSIQSMKTEWETLKEESKKDYKNLNKILHPLNNFSNYRKQLEEVEEQGKPYFPYLAIHLRDITSSQNIFELSGDKFNYIDQIIENGKFIFTILRAQSLRYQFELDKEIYNYIWNVKVLTSEEMVQMNFFDPNNQPNHFEEIQYHQLEVSKENINLLSSSFDKFSSSESLYTEKERDHKVPLEKVKEEEIDHYTREFLLHASHDIKTGFEFERLLKKSNSQHLWSLWKELTIIFNQKMMEQKKKFQQMFELYEKYFRKKLVKNFFNF